MCSPHLVSTHQCLPAKVKATLIPPLGKAIKVKSPGGPVQPVRPGTMICCCSELTKLRGSTRPGRANKLIASTLWLLRHGYVLGSYRIATAPERSSSRLTSFKSTCFDSPANSVGPWPVSLGCTSRVARSRDGFDR